MADQHNSNIPAMGNQISADIPDIKENLEFHKDIFENFINLWSATVATGIFPVKMGDADVDTLIQLEESADEDTIRFDCGGTEMATIDGTNGISADKISELTADTGVTIDGLLLKDSKLATANSVVASNVTDGIIAEAKLANSAVAQAKLKTSTQEVSTASTSLVNVSVSNVGSYGFYPQIKGSAGNSTITAQMCTTNSDPGTSYVTIIALSTDVGTAYAQFRYVTSSGEIYWLFFLIDKNTKEIISSSFGPDHPCLGNGGKPKIIAHPFMDYDSNKHEIIVINPDEKQVNEFRGKCEIIDEETPDRSILQVILEDYEIDYSAKAEWPNIPVTVKLNHADWNDPEPAEVVKKVIPKPDYIKVAKLKLKK